MPAAQFDAFTGSLEESDEATRLQQAAREPRRYRRG
jgi:hypothetical protein